MFSNNRILAALSCLALAAGGLTSGCSKSDPPPDLIKTQREAMQRAKAVEKTIMDSDARARQRTDEDSK